MIKLWILCLLLVLNYLVFRSKVSSIFFNKKIFPLFQTLFNYYFWQLGTVQMIIYTNNNKTPTVEQEFDVCMCSLLLNDIKYQRYDIIKTRVSPSAIGDLIWFCLSYLSPLYFFPSKTFSLLGFPIFYSELKWVVRTKIYNYVLLTQTWCNRIKECLVYILNFECWTSDTKSWISNHESRMILLGFRSIISCGYFM